jgi:hypothetical protein
MIGWSKMNEMLHDMTRNRMLLDVIIVLPEKKILKMRYNKHFI